MLFYFRFCSSTLFPLSKDWKLFLEQNKQSTVKMGHFPEVSLALAQISQSKMRLRICCLASEPGRGKNMGVITENECIGIIVEINY